MLLPILSAAVLLGVFVSMMLRGVAYVQRHPEVAQHGAPLAYQLCHLTLVHVVERYHQVGQRAAPAIPVRARSVHAGRVEPLPHLDGQVVVVDHGLRGRAPAVPLHVGAGPRA